MKTHIFHVFAIAALFVTALTGCSKTTAHFPVVRTVEVTLDSTSAAYTFSGQPVTAAGIEPECAKFGTSRSRIESARAKTVKLSLSDTSLHFGFAKSARVYLSADDLSETEIAAVDSVPADAGYELYLEVSDKDVRTLLAGNNLRLRLKLDSDEALPQDTELAMRCTFLVTAKQKRKKKK